MSCTINPLPDCQCVFVTYAGAMSIAELAATQVETHRLLDQRRWHRLVVDVTRLDPLPKATALIALAREPSSDAFRRARIALVVRPEQAARARFVEKIARSGRVFLAYFLDPEKATHWVQHAQVRRQTVEGKGRAALRACLKPVVPSTAKLDASPTSTLAACASVVAQAACLLVRAASCRPSRLFKQALMPNAGGPAPIPVSPAPTASPHPGCNPVERQCAV